LLQLAGRAEVLIIDEQAIYSPSDYNDRLLLGLKGTMSEAEQYWMRLRLEGGRLSKARRGELFMRPPAGYVWDDDTRRFRLDPDDHVQRAVRLVFERCPLDGSAYSVSRYSVVHGLLLPTRGGQGELRWHTPSASISVTETHGPHPRKGGRLVDSSEPSVARESCAPCDMMTPIACAGSIATYCSGGALVIYGCAATTFRTACAAGQPSSWPPCLPKGSACDPSAEPAGCIGDGVQVCADGDIVVVSCSSLGFASCEADMIGHARCVP
jgi:hypothetical protein